MRLAFILLFVIYRLVLDEQAVFLNLGRIGGFAEDRRVIIDARAIPEIDVTAAGQLARFFQRLRERSIEAVIAKAHLPLREAIARLDPDDGLAQTQFVPKLPEALVVFEGQTLPGGEGIGEPFGKFICVGHALDNPFKRQTLDRFL